MRMLRIAIVISVFLCLEALLMPLKADNRSDIEAIIARIQDLSEKDMKLEKEVVAKIYDIKGIVDNYSRTEKDMKGFNGLGKVEVLQLKAQRYAVEKQARKIIEREVMSLIDTLKKWESVQTQIKEDKKLLSLKQKIIELETNVVEEKAVSLKKEDIEYYTIKKDATLKEISELPEVYGDASAWQVLFQANRDKVKNPTDIVKKGITLIVPDLNNESNFNDL